MTDQERNFEGGEGGDEQSTRRLTKARVEQIGGLLDALPPAATDLSQQEAIAALLPSIRRLRARGYTLDAAAELLRAHGINVAPRTLTRHMKASGKRAPRARRGASVDQS